MLNKFQQKKYREYHNKIHYIVNLNKLQKNNNKIFINNSPKSIQKKK